ncbi:MAG: class I SAM-dependent methyltransferase [Solirubrobacterales bacterium]
MQGTQDFAPVARRLRDEIIEHYRARGESIDDESGLRTLDTNSILVPQRAELLIELVGRRGGRESVEGLDVADLGCGFGAVSLYLATAGARVVGVDPNQDRFEVGAKLAAELGLGANFRRGWIEALLLPDRSFDLIVLNNSFCYVTDRSDRRRALEHVFRIARPGARLVMRNPNLASPLDPFTGMPLVHQIPALVAKPFLELTARGRTRSKVRLVSGMAAKRELKTAGFDEVRVERRAAERRPARYQHATARRPPQPDEAISTT